MRCLACSPVAKEQDISPCHHSQHNQKAGAEDRNQETLYVMCNNPQDVASLQQHTEARNNPDKVRIERVASSASTTAKVAAV